jgi:hypothetical protein
MNFIFKSLPDAYSVCNIENNILILSISMRIGGVVRLDNGVVVNIAIKLLSCTMVCGLFHVILMDRPLVKAVSSFYITVFDI